MLNESETEMTRNAALSLVAAEGMRWNRVGRGQRFVVHIERDLGLVRALVKVASRGSAMVRTDIDDSDKATLSGFKDDVDHVLFAVKSPDSGDVAAYLVPIGEVEEAFRSAHRAWRARRPKIDNDNTTWVIWFTDRGDPDCNRFHEKWSHYRIGRSSVPAELHSSVEHPARPLGLSIEEAKAGIAARFNVAPAQIRITIEY